MAIIQVSLFCLNKYNWAVIKFNCAGQTEMVNANNLSESYQDEMKQQADKNLFDLDFTVLTIMSMYRIIKLAFNAEGCGTRRSSWLGWVTWWND